MAPGECRDVQPQPSSFRSGSCDRRVLQSVAVGPYDLVVLIGGKPVEGHFEARAPRRIGPARATLRIKISASVPISL